MTKEKKQIKAEKRSVIGRKVKKLRVEGLIPASIYGRGFDPISIQFETLEFKKLYDEVGESGLVELLVEDEVLPVLFRNPQYNPITDEIIHIDCYKVNLKEKITAMVPIVLIGESQAVKNGNILVEVTGEIEVEALPTDLPENIEIDISSLNEIDEMITVETIKLGDKIEIKTQLDQVIVKIEAPKVEEEVVTEEEAGPEDVPAMNQKGEGEEGGENEKEDKEKEGKKED